MNRNSGVLQDYEVPTSPDALRHVAENVIADVASQQRTLQLERATAVRAAPYIRVSRLESRETSYSMQIQPDRSADYARNQGWTVVGLYEDPDRSGRHSKRPALKLLERDVKAGKIDVIIVHRLDRLYRNLESLLRFIRFLRRHHVRLVSVTEQIDTDTYWGRLVLYVLGAIAEMYVLYTSERTREAKATRVSHGLPNGAYRFGYCNGRCSQCSDPNGSGYCPFVGSPDRGNGRVLIPHPIESQAVRIMASLYRQGLSDQDIADFLNSHDFILQNLPEA
ncbi:Transposon gamma-delta resolvase [uncultured bacterium]|nr:Transposon gamma-delta resolvase [uncultured bacterium]